MANKISALGRARRGKVYEYLRDRRGVPTREIRGLLRLPTTQAAQSFMRTLLREGWVEARIEWRETPAGGGPALKRISVYYLRGQAPGATVDS